MNIRKIICILVMVLIVISTRFQVIAQPLGQLKNYNDGDLKVALFDITPYTSINIYAFFNSKASNYNDTQKSSYISDNVAVTDYCKIYRNDQIVFDNNNLQSENDTQGIIKFSGVDGLINNGGVFADYFISSGVNYTYRFECEYKGKNYNLSASTIVQNSNPYISSDYELGGKLYWNGGDVRINVMPETDADSNNVLFLRAPKSTLNSMYGSKNKGEWIITEAQLLDLGMTQFGKTDDKELSRLRFGYNHGGTSANGDARRDMTMFKAQDTIDKSDEKEEFHTHARMKKINEGFYRLVFEDLRFTWGDMSGMDWNDMVFEFNGNFGNSSSAQCGPAARTYVGTEAFAASGFCTKGIPNPTIPADPQVGQPPSLWTCTEGASTVPCQATRSNTTTTEPKLVLLTQGKMACDTNTNKNPDPVCEFKARAEGLDKSKSYKVKFTYKEESETEYKNLCTTTSFSTDGEVKCSVDKDRCLQVKTGDKTKVYNIRAEMGDAASITGEKSNGFCNFFNNILGIDIC